METAPTILRELHLFAKEEYEMNNTRKTIFTKNMEMEDDE
jgi:hypothetical protein